ncbi:MAG: ComF family protein [bacterium]
MIDKFLSSFFNAYLHFYRFIFFESVCPFCGFFSLNSICKNCQDYFQKMIRLRKLSSNIFEKELGKVYFDNIYFLFLYSEFSEFIKAYKFENRAYLLNDVVNFLYSIKGSEIWQDVDGITFVPNHDKFLNYLICIFIGTKMGLRVFPFFSVNSKNRKLQHLIEDRKERIKNVKNKFLIKRASYIEKIKKLGKIVIFDDISTTGASLNEASKIIKSYNNEIRIDCLVLAKA